MRRTLVLLTLALLLVPVAIARADSAYESVAAAYASAGGHLDGCAFTQQQLEAGLAGIPPQLRDVIPDLRKAIEDGIAAHERGDCAGREPGTATTPPSPSASGAVPPVTTTPVTPTAPATGVGTTPAQPAPAAATPAPASATTSSQPQQAPAAGPRQDDRTALVVALVALGALLLLVLAVWGWARLRGWDPVWAMRARHAWGEAGFRTTTTWSEFTDWLRLGR